MKTKTTIEIHDQVATEFCKLNFGSTFIIKNGYRVYIQVPLLRNDSGFQINTVCLNDGSVALIDDKQQVFPVDVTISATRTQ